uniref:Uncharacterized protein n=1 Tax=Stegastes partitus TaxID=144197 RepID=A0A3B4ZY14_9TELE
KSAELEADVNTHPSPRPQRHYSPSHRFPYTDEEIFSTKYSKEFPNSFESLVKKICRYLFHMLTHLYWGHLNTLYAHFIETCIIDDPSDKNSPKICHKFLSILASNTAGSLFEL